MADAGQDSETKRKIFIKKEVVLIFANLKGLKTRSFGYLALADYYI